MKGLKLVATILALGTLAIAPNAEATSLLNNPQTLEFAGSQNKNDIKTYIERGFQHLESDNYRGAIESFSQVLKIDSNNQYAYLGRGLGYFGLEQYRQAKTDFDQAIALAPDLAYAHYFRGFTNFVLNDKSSAIADLQKASILFKQEGKQDLAQKANDAIEKIQAS